MKTRLLSILIAFLFPFPGWATCLDDGNCDPNADVVRVRQDCTGLSNCFESVAKLSGSSELCAEVTVDPSLPFGSFVALPPAPPTFSNLCQTNGWLWSVRDPSETSPVVVDIGPGVFEPFVCPLRTGTRFGHAKVRGAGRDQTKLFSAETTAISAYGCEEMTFSELTAEAPVYGVRWIGGGEATWSRVDMIANTDLVLASALRAGWADGCVGADKETSQHFIHESRSVVTGHSPGLNAAYVSDCAETYYFGGALVNSTTGSSYTNAGLLMGGYPFYVGDDTTSFRGFDVQVVVEVERVGGGIDSVGLDVRADTLAELQDGSIHVDVVPAEGASADAIGIRTQTGAVARRLVVPIDATTSSGSASDREDL